MEKGIIKYLKELQAEMAEKGLTQEILDEILADEDDSAQETQE